VCKHWRFDLGHIGGTGLISVEWNCSIKVRAHPHGQYVDNAPTEAKADGTELTGTFRARFQPCCRGQKVFGHIGAIDLGE
jgi:hypothetical protein